MDYENTFEEDEYGTDNIDKWMRILQITAIILAIAGIYLMYRIGYISI